MDVDAKELGKFANDLMKIYETLAGEAKIEEPYGMHMYLSMKGDGLGHIKVEGYLYNTDTFGSRQVLEYQNVIDQIVLKEFCFSLSDSYKKYAKNNWACKLLK